ncbi:hypothetical protein BDC45DRAFT_554535 [Circinella umbellata]|nr:hypothetical protein BDC45DRAFT_554535 [Circinella umbellata]
MSWEPQVGDVIYSAGDSQNEEVWDDSELIEHWDTAMEEYRLSQGISNDLPPFTSSRNEKDERGKERRHQKKLKQDKPKKDNSNGNTSNNDSFHPPPPPPPLAQQFSTMSSSNRNNNNNTSNNNQADSDFSNLLMAWYYSGYYTGCYQASRE